MHCTIAAPRTKLASTTSSRLNCATAHHRRWHPIRALQLLAGFLLAASLGSIAHAQPIGGTTSLTGTSQLFLRPNPGCNAGFGSTSYATVEFVAATSGTYMFRTTSSTTEGHVDDPFLVVYQSPFNPAAATTNCLGANDDGGGGWESLISLELTAGNIYTAVITTYSPGGAGLITWSAMGEGVLTYVISVKKAVTSAPTATGGTLTVQLSDADAVRWVALPSGAPAPSALQVVAGNDSTGAAGVTSGTAEVEAADTDVAIAIVGLAASSTYDVYVVAFNGGSGSGVRKATLTTSSPPPPPPDTTPEAFMFPPQTGLPPTSERTSTIVVHGIDSPTPISITTGSFSINGGPQVTSGTVIDGDEVTVSQLTSSNLNEANTTTLTIGGVSAVFSVTTGDLNPLITADSFTGPEEACLEGGVRLSFGDDYNDDGTLDESELESGRNLYICNGVNLVVTSRTLGSNPLICPNGGVELTMGVPQISQSDTESPQNPVVVSNICNGLKSLVHVEGLDGDEECPAGGVRVFTWVDKDGDGDLSESEDDISQKVCNGVNALVQMTTLSPDPTVCARGGTLVTVGTDGDADGTLDPEEVTATAKLCNDAHSLVDTKQLAPNPKECPTGGVEIVSGADANSNGALDTAEIIKSRKLCNAISAVSRTTELESDEDVCPNGGTRLESGLDVDGDHELDNSEVSTSALVCNGTNLAIRTVELETGSEECPAGGSALESGVDSNGDGELNGSEVSKRQALCQPPQLLFETTAVKVDDDDCPHGGLRVTSGHDDGKSSGTAGDGKLQPGEIELDKAVCLAPTDVLVSGGSGSCTVTPGQRGSTGLLWAALLGLATVVVRRRRRALGRNN